VTTFEETVLKKFDALEMGLSAAKEENETLRSMMDSLLRGASEALISEIQGIQSGLTGEEKYASAERAVNLLISLSPRGETGVRTSSPKFLFHDKDKQEILEAIGALREELGVKDGKLFPLVKSSSERVDKVIERLDEIDEGIGHAYGNLVEKMQSSRDAIMSNSNSNAREAWRPMGAGM